MLPQGFLDYISQYQELAPLASALLTPPEVAVRENPAKPGLAPQGEPVPWCELGRLLGERPQFTFDPALHQGAYYVQDASSMAIYAVVKEIAAEQGRALRYLDACAAPGGKTTAAISALPAGSLVVANEYDFKRAEILAENVAKWGARNCVVTRGDTRRLRKLGEFFDIAAVDAPCSGEGMMRKDPQASAQWSPGLVASCALVQREILGNAWAALRPGGFLIYSTCTFNRAENEENLQWMLDELGAEPAASPSLDGCPEIANGIGIGAPCYRFLPGRVRGEGLFLCIVRKPGIAKAQAERPEKSGKEKLPEYASWLQDPAGWTFQTVGQDAYAWPRANARAIQEVAKHLDAISPGLRIAAIKGRDAIPAQELALSTAINPSAFPAVELSKDQAIEYLQRQNIQIDAQKGFVLLTYGGLPLGFVKNLGPRANNLYPKNWRILKR